MAFSDSDLKHPNALERVRELFAKAPFLAHLGVELRGVGPGWAELALPVKSHLFQAEGFVHAGAVTTLADHASGAAASTLIAANQTVLAVEFKVTLMRPAIGDELRCRAEVLRAGRTLTFTEAKVYAVTGGESKLCATFTGTIANVAAQR